MGVYFSHFFMCLVGGLVLVHNGQARRESTVLQFPMNTQLTHKPIVSYIFNRVALRRNSSDLSCLFRGSLSMVQQNMDQLMLPEFF